MPTVSEELVKEARSYLADIVSFPKDQIGGLLVNRVDIWKFANKVRCLLLARKFRDANPFEIIKVSPDLLIPLLEEAGMVENERIAKMYASLIICFTNSAAQKLVHPSYARVLGQLSQTDITLLDRMYDGIKHQGGDYEEKGFDLETAAKLFELDTGVCMLSFQNLWRLGVCHNASTFSGTQGKHMIVFTGFGWQLLTACKIIS